MVAGAVLAGSILDTVGGTKSPAVVASVALTSKFHPLVIAALIAGADCDAFPEGVALTKTSRMHLSMPFNESLMSVVWHGRGVAGGVSVR